jgi:hypothetical protein
MADHTKTLLPNLAALEMAALMASLTRIVWGLIEFTSKQSGTA